MQRLKNKRWRKICKWIERHEVLIFVLLGVAILRIPNLFEPNRYADEDIYLALGQGLRKGLAFYRDIHDNKPPLLYAFAGLAGNVMWFRLILMAWNLVNVVLVWKLAQKMVKKMWIVGAITALFGLLSSIPLIEGNIANGEIFMIMPVTAGVLLIVLETSKKKFNWLKWFGAGVLFSVGLLFKMPVLFDVLGVLFWLTLYQAKNLVGAVKAMFDKRMWVVIVGLLVPVVIVSAYYVLIGAGEPFLRSALGQNIGYLSSFEGDSTAKFYEGGLFQRGLVVVVWFFGLWLMRKRVGKEMGLATLWLIAGLFGANLAGRPYPHYMVEIIVPGLLVAGIMVDKMAAWRVGLGALALSMIVLALWRYNYWHYQTLPYYQNFVKYAGGQIDKDEYYSFFGDGVLRNYEVSRYINIRTNEDEKIFVWGTEPAIYVLSDRLPVGRYTVAYHIKDFDGWDETMIAVEKEEPKFVVTMEYEDDFDDLEAYLMTYYVQVKEVDNAQIWRRIR